MQRLSTLFALWLITVSAPSQADYEAGLLAVENGDYATALQEFTAAAEEGLDMAQYNLAILYYAGQGVQQDLQEAFRWTEKAAEQGHIAAQFNLGALYYEGDGIKRDREKAFEWYSKAADADYAPAQFNLAEMYFLGNGVEKDPILAHAWINRAIENDYAFGNDLLDDIEKKLSKEQLSEARRVFARMKIAL